MIHNANIINILQFTMTHYCSLESRLVNGRCKSCTKKHLEFENNTVDHTTFLVWPACRLGQQYMCALCLKCL